MQACQFEASQNNFSIYEEKKISFKLGSMSSSLFLNTTEILEFSRAAVVTWWNPCPDYNNNQDETTVKDNQYHHKTHLSLTPFLWEMVFSMTWDIDS